MALRFHRYLIDAVNAHKKIFPFKELLDIFDRFFKIIYIQITEKSPMESHLNLCINFFGNQQKTSRRTSQLILNKHGNIWNLPCVITLSIYESCPSMFSKFLFFKKITHIIPKKKLPKVVRSVFRITILHSYTSSPNRNGWFTLILIFPR